MLRDSFNTEKIIVIANANKAATVAHIGHEMYEPNKFEDIVLMKLADFRKAIMDSKSGGATNNWHEQAWDYADSLVTKMRGAK